MSALNLTCPTCGGVGILSGSDAPFGMRVSIRRKQLEMTQEQLAKAVGLSRAAVANIETCRAETGLSKLRDFATALELSVEDLVP